MMLITFPPYIVLVMVLNESDYNLIFFPVSEFMSYCVIHELVNFFISRKGVSKKVTKKSYSV